jgi:hypothetical protein
MRSTVNITAQAEVVQCSAKTTGTELECQFAGSSITPFFTQPEKIDVVVKCNDVEITSNITFIDIDLSVNQVGICTLNSPNVSGFKVNDIIEVEFTITGYGQVKVFYGYIDRIEKNHLNQGQIVCADVLRDLRDGVLTQIIAEFSPTFSGYAKANFTTQPILPCILDDYTINVTLKDTCRELSFANANKLQILQQMADEYCLVFWVNYQNNKVVLNSVNTSDTFELPLEHSFTITDRSKANTGVKVTYAYDYEKPPEYKSESETISNYEGGELISKTYITSSYLGNFQRSQWERVYGHLTLGGETDWKKISVSEMYSSASPNHTRRETQNYGWRLDGSTYRFKKISATIEREYYSSEGKITSRTVETYGYKVIDEEEEYTLLTKTEERFSSTGYYTSSSYGWETIGGEEIFVKKESRRGFASDNYSSFPMSEIVTDEKSILIGSEENPIYINTSYISYADEAKALADWKVLTELQSQDIDIEIRKIIPGLKAGEYVTSNDFEGSCFIETVNYQYNVQNKNCRTMISGVLLNAENN